MNTRNHRLFPILAVSLALCLPQFALAQEAGAMPAAKNMNEMKFGPLPGLPTCLSGAIESGNPLAGPGIILAKLTTGCSVPWHWHTAGEHVMVVKGSGRIDIKDSESKTLQAGGFTLLPAHHVHQFRCTKSCVMFIYTDAAFDIHYVDAKGNEISPDNALKAVKENAPKT